MLGVALLAGACQSTRVYLVRHAEKATQPASDPDLTDIGKERAQDLAALLADEDIKAIYSTNYRRTRLTATPLAEKRKLNILTYTPDSAAKIVTAAFKSKKNTLIVGHSNTLIPTLKSLGLKPSIEQISDNDYDNMFILRKRQREWILEHRTFGKTSPATDNQPLSYQMKID